MLHKLPNKFAAAISICGGGFAHWADRISSTPFWMLHGSLDHINLPEITEHVYNELTKLGATKMRYTNYPGYDHAIWDKAQSEPSFYEWMFAFDKSKSDYAPPQGRINLSGQVDNKIHLHWTDIRNGSNISDKIWFYDIFGSKGLIARVGYEVTNYSFSPLSNIDTFKIQAINYNFKKSDFSNLLYFNDGKLLTSLPDTIDKK